jgi:virginiamycin B lyase
MDTNGKILAKYPMPSGCGPYALVAGPENSLWFADQFNNCVGRVTLTGTMYAVPTFAAYSSPQAMSIGPGGKLWFIESAHSGLGFLDPATI